MYEPTSVTPGNINGQAMSRYGVTELNNRLERLLLVSQAVWELLQETANLTEEDLFEKVTEIDARDGVEDGVYSRPLAKCRKCGSAICRKYVQCLFCGEPFESDTAFSEV